MKNQKGSTILMVLLIIGTVTPISLFISRIILNSLMTSRNIDSSAVAYYASESGIEKNLYAIRKEDYGVEYLKTNSLYNSGTLNNNSTWHLYLDECFGSKSEINVPEIRKDNSYQVDLYNPDDSLTSQNIRSIRIEWDGDPAAKLEVSWSSWKNGNFAANTNKRFFSNAESPIVMNLSTIENNAANIYRLRLKALYNNINNINLRAYSLDNGVGEQTNIPSIITLKSVGEFSNNKQAVQVEMSRKSPVSGVWDFVIFSQKDIVKE